MSSGSRCFLIGMTLIVMSSTARAQDGAAASSGDLARSDLARSDLAEQQRTELHDAVLGPECERDEFQPDTIVVCAQTSEEEQAREVMSVLPEPVQSDRNLVGGVRDQPCWIAPRGGVCVRGGYRPPQVVLIDLDAIPEALTPEEAALVSAVELPDN